MRGGKRGKERERKREGADRQEGGWDNALPMTPREKRVRETGGGGGRTISREEDDDG